MRPNINDKMWNILCLRHWKLWIVVLFFASITCRQYSHQPKHPSPPDLSNCTRIEIAYLPSTLEYFFPSASSQGLLSTAEIQYLKSVKRIVVEDRKTIKAFAYDVSRAVYQGPASRSLGIANAAHVLCYRGGEQQTDFIMMGGLIQTKDDHEFQFHRIRTDWQMITPKIWPFEVRVECRGNLRELRRYFPKYFQNEQKYPPPEKWCDVIVRTIHSQYGSAKSRVGVFRCPSVHKGKCNYAINPNCGPNSPLDTVLVFETKAGWNQHGGPELFTFDNHDPKGGCVLLNDGTVKFIRTQEELQQLRWK